MQQRRRFVEASATVCTACIKTAADRSFVPSFLPLAIFIDSIKTVILHGAVVVEHLCKWRCRGSAVYPGACYSAPATLSELAHPQQMCQRPLCSRRDLCTHPADSWRAAKTLDGRFAGFTNPLGRRFEIGHRCLCSKFLVNVRKGTVRLWTNVLAFARIYFALFLWTAGRFMYRNFSFVSHAIVADRESNAQYLE